MLKASRHLCILLATSLALWPTPQLESQSPAPINLSLGTAFELHSKALGTSRSILVSLPDQYESSQASFPVLVLLDAEDQFRSAVATVRFLASRSIVPDMIVVGVVNGVDRTHDLTPPATGKTATGNPTAGGADSLLTFISEELLPWAEQHYRTSQLHLLAGHSFGGLFALQAAIAEPSAFRIIIAMSPSLWWNDAGLLDYYAQGLARRTTPLSLFITSGSLEPIIDQPTSLLIARLDSIEHPAIVLSYLHYVGDGHGLTPFYSLADGLRSTFQPLAVPFDSVLAALTIPAPADSASIAAALTMLETRYEVAARSFGMPPVFPEAPMNALGYVALAKYPNFAVSIFRTNVERYPQSANTYDSLGDGLLAAQDTSGAINAFRQAVTVATQHNDPVGAGSQAKLDSLMNHH